MCGNNDAMIESSRKEFLTLDQKALEEKFHLDGDPDYLYIKVLNHRYGINRVTGEISDAEGQLMVPHDISMAIYDALSFTKDQKEIPQLFGEWATLAELGGIVGAGHERKLHSPLLLRPFKGKNDALKAACEQLGGKPVKGGDVSYILPVFDFLPFWFQYWDADEEFPASIQYCWDKNADKICHYEILYYTTKYIVEHLGSLVG